MSAGRTSALLEGRVVHERLAPREHRFARRLFLLQLDLDELEDLLRDLPGLSTRVVSPLRFRRADYLGDPARPLREAVLERVEHELGRRPQGAVHLVTHLRTFGYLFNPVSFYLCHDGRGELDAVVAEITNTPWNERHAYVLDAAAARREGRVGPAGELQWRFPKTFHVSPFFDLDHEYLWSLGLDDASVRVHMTNHTGGRAVFHAGLTLARRPLTARSLWGAMLRYPFLTVRVHLAIYLQALFLWAKRTPFFPHPEKRPPAEEGLVR